MKWDEFPKKARLATRWGTAGQCSKGSALLVTEGKVRLARPVQNFAFKFVQTLQQINIEIHFPIILPIVIH